MNEKAKCLLVDDVKENLLALTALLADEDVEPIVARSGVEALELLLVHDVALALLDVQMPEMDGYQLAELMRGTERTRQIPIIFLTAANSDDARTFKGYEAGAVDVLYKPIKAFILKSKIRIFLELDRQRRQLAKDLETRSETLRMNELFVATLGHDLRNPLTAILMSADALKRRSDPKMIEKTADTIAASGQRMARMIDDILDLARMRLGQGIKLRSVTVDLLHILETVVEELKASNPGRCIALTCSGNTGTECDPDRIAQVVSNLIANAIQHGAPDDRVEISADGSNAERIEIRVSNSGSIAAGLLPRIFDPFLSGRHDSGRRGGLGLGLYIVQQVVLAHRGDIAAECREGKTIFHFRIPRQSTPARDDGPRVVPV